jgi:hypothetical protein
MFRIMSGCPQKVEKPSCSWPSTAVTQTQQQQLLPVYQWQLQQQHVACRLCYSRK